MVVSNHGLITTGLTMSKQRFGLKIPVLTFATEPHNISAYWADPLADHIVVPSEEVWQDLLGMGVPPSKMAIVGYPVQQAFLKAPNKAEARVRLGLENRLTCLVSLGGEGVARKPHKLICTLLDSDISLQVVVITGRNKALRSQLQRLRPGSDKLRVEGFIDDMAGYLAASDVVVGKGGPASVYEALAVGRPVIITSYIGLNELGVVRFIERQGLGHYVKSPEALLEKVQHYASDPGLLEKVALRCRGLELAVKTEQLAHYLVHYACAST
jgi:UDP-N-acetylglucosamine:LPS N-acetylglucosamine transferase